VNLVLAAEGGFQEFTLRGSDFAVHRGQRDEDDEGWS